MALVRQRRELTLVPPAALRLESGRRLRAQDSGLAAIGAAARPGRRISHQPQAPAEDRQYANAAPSWWAARAREGEVKPGFTKADILRPAQKEDPRAPGGVFERVGALLSELLDQR